MNSCKQLEQLGQAIWFDYIKRDLITSGELRRLITEDGLRGMTSNPTIFEKAIVESHDYEESIYKLVGQGKSAEEIYDSLTQQDVQMAADEFRPVYERTDGLDGYVSIEVNPHLAYDTQGTIIEARRLWKEINRPNIFIKVPATLEGLPAIEQLIFEGLNINITLLFGLPRYRQVAQAFISGLRRRMEQKKDLKRIASVASFFLSRIDVLLDPLFNSMIGQGSTRAEKATKLQGTVAIASAKMAYQIYKELFHHKIFQSLAEKGACPQRLLWASTSTKNPIYSDVKYVNALIGKETVTTVPPETFTSFKDHGVVASTLEQETQKAKEVFDELLKVGIEIDRVTQQLEQEGVQKFITPFDRSLAALKKAMNR